MVVVRGGGVFEDRPAISAIRDEASLSGGVHLLPPSQMQRHYPHAKGTVCDILPSRGQELEWFKWQKKRLLLNYKYRMNETGSVSGSSKAKIIDQATKWCPAKR